MEWRDNGVLLTVRPFGETSTIVEVFTRAHGRHAGIVRGGASRKLGPVLQPGNQLDVAWRARLEDHLGSYRVELETSRAAGIMGNRQALAGLNSICGLLKFGLPEREPHPGIYASTIDLLDGLPGDRHFAKRYLLWELRLLEGLGFGLDLGSCAVTGQKNDLAYVSPKSGRAVSTKAAGEWQSQLLDYPDVTTPKGILRGLETTGYFLDHRLARSLGGNALPDARSRLVALLRKAREARE